jgi:FKBP-type peptidyl-prolyl cis-trans isomerase
MLDADGSMFDNSFSRGAPIDVNLGQGMVIKGWDEGIALLKKGTKATLYIPSALGYGPTGQPPVIPENADLIFYVEVQE